jgi:hypothetical protein
MGARLLLFAALKLSLRLELGAEYDSNANRAEVVQGAPPPFVDVPTGSFLLRSTARGALAWRAGKNVLSLTGLLGGKVFFKPAVQDQNMLVGQLGLDDRVRAARWLELGLSGDYYDVGQECTATPCDAGLDRHRDFRSGSTLARITFLDDPGLLSLLGGYRGFQWKPDSRYDFQAGQATVLTSIRLTAGPPDHEHEIDLSASYHLERRFYDALTEVNTCGAGMPLDPSTCINPGSDFRRDWFHEAGLQLTWVGPLLVSAGYGVQLNDSNSFDQSLLRHLVSLKLASRLFWQLYLTIKGQLLVTRYRDPIVFYRVVNSQTLVSIEDENRNEILVDLERPIGTTGLAVEARYSFYTNELGGTPVSFRRHVGYLGLSYRLSRNR